MARIWPLTGALSTLCVSVLRRRIRLIWGRVRANPSAVIAYVPKHSDDCGPKTMDINVGLLSRYVTQGGRIADLGAGRGELSRRVKGGGFEVVAIELNEPNPEDFPGIEAHQADLQVGIPLEDSSCDGAIAQEVAHQLENPWFLFREVARILRPGGFFVVSVPNLDHLFIRAYQVVFKKTPFFLEHHYRHAHQVTPIPRWNLERMGEHAGLTLQEATYNLNYVPGLRLELKLPTTVPRLGHTLITVWRK